MAVKDILPTTYQLLGVFRPQMYSDTSLKQVRILGDFSNNEGERFVSCKGRIYCLIRLTTAPLRLIFFTVSQIIKIAALAFLALANLFTCDRHAFVKRVQQLTDAILTFAIHPLCFTVECIRNLFGFIHPGAVFADNPLVIVNPNPPIPVEGLEFD